MREGGVGERRNKGRCNPEVKSQRGSGELVGN